jgi:hypothetical protein
LLQAVSIFSFSDVSFNHAFRCEREASTDNGASTLWLFALSSISEYHFYVSPAVISTPWGCEGQRESQRQHAKSRTPAGPEAIQQSAGDQAMMLATAPRAGESEPFLHVPVRGFR